MPSTKVHVILNPKSGGGRAYRQRNYIARELAARGLEAQLHLTEAPRHGTALARQLADAGADIIAAAGGDGTIHDVANGILQSAGHATLAVMPLGTGNDFAKIVTGSKTPFDTIAHGTVRSFDVGRARWPSGEEFFVNGAGTGIDVEVVRQILRLPYLPGPIKYLLGLFRALAVYDPIRVAAAQNGQVQDHEVMMMAVGNGVCQGGGFYLTPRARPDDGRLDLCIINSIPIWKVAIVLPRVLRGTHESHPVVDTRLMESIRFEARDAAPLYFQLDGELREPADAHWLEISVVPAALRVLTAADNS